MSLPPSQPLCHYTKYSTGGLKALHLPWLQISLEVEDRGPKAGILKVSADHVRVQIKAGVTHPAAGEELMEFMRSVLGERGV